MAGRGTLNDAHREASARTDLRGAFYLTAWHRISEDGNLTTE